MYPALAVYQRLPEADRNRVLWVGSQGGIEADLLARYRVSFRAIPAGKVHGVGWRRLLPNAVKILRGYRASRRLLREFRPQVLFFTGGFVAAPMGFAARKRVPIALFVPDIKPGLALQVLARFARRIFVVAEESRGYFPNKEVEVVGYPVREEILTWNRERARAFFRLPPKTNNTGSSGGSLGARSINLALWKALPRLLSHMHVVHITGRRDWPLLASQKPDLPASLLERYHPFPYLHEEMGAALAAADLAVSRAGASTLGELPAHGLPAVLVPYPYAWDYQKVNAAYLVDRGAAVLLPDEELEERLVPFALDLMADVERRRAMRRAMKALFRPDAAQSMARGLAALAQGGV